MAVRRFLMFVAVAALVCAADIEENEQKKRGAGKTTTLNAIPTGAQKPEYTYNIYPQSTQNNPSPQYQTVSSSFYPTQGASQYYSQPPEASPQYPLTQPQYPQQPQINLIPPPTSSQFVPLNFIPNPSYQTKYQIVPSKTQNGNIQLAIVPQTHSLQSPSIFPYQFFTPNSGHLNQQSPLQGPINFGQNYQLPFGNPFLGQPSTMFLLAQPNPSIYNNLLYPNPAQNLYNYYPSNVQTKYNPSLPPSSIEYEKIQGPVSKDDNDLSVHSSEYSTSSIQPSDGSSYKNAYNSRTSYSKI